MFLCQPSTDNLNFVQQLFSFVLHKCATTQDQQVGTLFGHYALLTGKLTGILTNFTAEKL